MHLLLPMLPMLSMLYLLLQPLELLLDVGQPRFQVVSAGTPR